MRIVRVTTSDQRIDFHPRLTVLYGLDAAARAKVVGDIVEITSGRAPSTPALVEAFGLLLNADGRGLAMLDLKSEHEPVIAEGDLTWHSGDSSHGGREDTAARRERIIREAAEAESKMLPLRDEVRDCERLLESFDDKLERMPADGRPDDSSLNHESAERIEPAVTAILAMESEHDLPAGSALFTSTDELTGRLKRLVGYQSSLVRYVDSAGADQRNRVATALTAASDAMVDEPGPSPVACALATKIEDLRTQLIEAESRFDSDVPVVEIRRSVRIARARVAAAESELAKPPNDPADVAELEAAHDAVLDASDDVGGRFNNSKATKALADAREREQAILDKMGFPTWSSYLLETSAHNTNLAAQQELTDAQDEWLKAKGAWDEVNKAMQEDEGFAALLAEMGACREQAVVMTGQQADLPAALRAMRTPPPTEEARAAAIAELREALNAAHVEVPGESPSNEQVVAQAAVWLASAGARSSQAERLEAAVAQIRVEESRVQKLLDQYGTSQPAAAPADFEPLVVDLAACEATFDDYIERLIDQATSVLELAALEQQRSATHDRLQAAQGELRDATDKYTMLMGRVTALTEQTKGRRPDAAMSRLAVKPTVDPHEQVRKQISDKTTTLKEATYAGSLPLVADHCLKSFPDEAVFTVLTALESMSTVTQVILLTDRVDVVEWASHLGTARALLVRPSRATAEAAA